MWKQPIHGFQGHERDVIVLSLVRSNSEGRLGHADDGRRLNVALTRAKRALVVIGNKDTLRRGYEGGLTSFIRNVYNRGAVIEVPPDQRRPAHFLSGDAKEVVMDPDEAKATADSMVVPSRTKRATRILRTAAAWIPLADGGVLPSLDAVVDALIEHADNLLGRMPWLVALAYSLGLPYRNHLTVDLPESALEWDMKAHSRQHFSQQSECRWIQAMLCCRACYWSACAARERVYTRALCERAPRATECRSSPTYLVSAVRPAK